MIVLLIYIGNYMYVMIIIGWFECFGFGNKFFWWFYIFFSVNSGVVGKFGFFDGGFGILCDGVVGIYG